MHHMDYFYGVNVIKDKKKQNQYILLNFFSTVTNAGFKQKYFVQCVSNTRKYIRLGQKDD